MYFDLHVLRNCSNVSPFFFTHVHYYKHILHAYINKSTRKYVNGNLLYNLWTFYNTVLQYFKNNTSITHNFLTRNTLSQRRERIGKRCGLQFLGEHLKRKKPKENSHSHNNKKHWRHNKTTEYKKFVVINHLLLHNHILIYNCVRQDKCGHV